MITYIFGLLDVNSTKNILPVAYVSKNVNFLLFLANMAMLTKNNFIWVFFQYNVTVNVMLSTTLINAVWVGLSGVNNYRISFTLQRT